MKIAYHLIANGLPFCQWTGCQAHQALADDAGVTACGYDTVKDALAAAHRLQVNGVSRVAVGLGYCEEV